MYSAVEMLAVSTVLITTSAPCSWSMPL